MWLEALEAQSGCCTCKHPVVEQAAVSGGCHRHAEPHSAGIAGLRSVHSSLGAFFTRILRSLHVMEGVGTISWPLISNPPTVAATTIQLQLCCAGKQVALTESNRAHATLAAVVAAGVHYCHRDVIHTSPVAKGLTAAEQEASRLHTDTAQMMAALESAAAACSLIYAETAVLCGLAVAAAAGSCNV